MLRLRERIETRLATRRRVSALVRELGEHLGAAARDPARLQARACPVCPPGTGVDPDPVIVGPVYAFHRCRGCSLIFAPRVLRHEALRALYRERPIYKTYWEHTRADAEAMVGRPVYAELIDGLLERAPGRDAAIDVGCGFGKLVAELRPHFQECFGLELNRRTAQAGAKLFGVEIRPERLERLDRAPESVDLVVMNQVLEHLQELRGLLSAAHRLLRPRGLLWIGLPHGASLGMRLLGGAHPYISTHVHVNLFTAPALERLASAAGFQVARLGTTDGIDLSAGDLVIERLPPVPAQLLFAPAAALDKAARRLCASTALPSRLGLGSHLEALLVKP